jgi:hypothetical protein
VSSTAEPAVIESIVSWHKENGIQWDGGFEVCAQLVGRHAAAGNANLSGKLLGNLFGMVSSIIPAIPPSRELNQVQVKASLLEMHNMLGLLRDLHAVMRLSAGPNHPHTLEVAYLLVEVMAIQSTSIPNSDMPLLPNRFEGEFKAEGKNSLFKEFWGLNHPHIKRPLLNEAYELAIDYVIRAETTLGAKNVLSLILRDRSLFLASVIAFPRVYSTL